jgi:hypothetical protein
VTQPALQLVVNNDGEVTGREERCPDCINYEREVRRLLRENARLRGENKRKRDESPDRRDAGLLFDYWVRQRGKNPKRVVFDDKRQERALWAIKHYGLQRSKHVIDAQDIAPWKKGDKVYDDFCTIFKNASAVEYFEGVMVQACSLPIPMFPKDFRRLADLMEAS